MDKANKYEVQNQANENAKNTAGLREKPKRFNILAFIFCVIFAFGIWLYVMNTDIDAYEKNVMIPLSVKNEDAMANGMSIVNSASNMYVTVTLKGNRADVLKIDENNIESIIDVSGIKNPGKQAVKISVINVPGGVSVTDIKPSSLTVYADVMTSKEVPVRVKTYQSTNASYSVVAKPQYQSVTVSGPQIELDKISSAFIQLELGELKMSMTTSSGELLLLDKNGNTVSSPYLKVVPNDMNVNVSLTTEKKVNLIFDYDKNIVRDIYSFTNSVNVVGLVEILDGLESITVRVDASGITENVSNKTIKIVPPAGIELASSEEDSVTVILYIKNVG